MASILVFWSAVRAVPLVASVSFTVFMNIMNGTSTGRSFLLICAPPSPNPPRAPGGFVSFILGPPSPPGVLPGGCARAMVPAAKSSAAAERTERVRLFFIFMWLIVKLLYDAKENDARLPLIAENNENLIRCRL